MHVNASHSGPLDSIINSAHYHVLLLCTSLPPNLVFRDFAQAKLFKSSTRSRSPRAISCADMLTLAGLAGKRKTRKITVY